MAVIAAFTLSMVLERTKQSRGTETDEAGGDDDFISPSYTIVRCAMTGCAEMDGLLIVAFIIGIPGISLPNPVQSHEARGDMLVDRTKAPRSTETMTDKRFLDRKLHDWKVIAICINDETAGKMGKEGMWTKRRPRDVSAGPVSTQQHRLPSLIG
ncbi:hypothetical protein M422DRAFT_272962 [Sphaerobolus stellatus SS14]|uniref:Uncharacterized protein n=1 Tax=Sphaerobolus stellatus (strain SS14) TaxID=990650 RepID=A0A0C9TAA6_SPHS4|nr:hypothetical protein M422DRAFT_272962 [Sphaerobolus stellatus SS14]